MVIVQFLGKAKPSQKVTTLEGQRITFSRFLIVFMFELLLRKHLFTGCQQDYLESFRYVSCLSHSWHILSLGMGD